MEIRPTSRKRPAKRTGRRRARKGSGKWRRGLRWVSITAFLALAALVGWATALVIFTPNVHFLKTNTPRRTALMEQRLREHERDPKPYRIRRYPVPLSRISRYLRWAVVVSEDASFYSHKGVDFDEMRASLQTDVEEKRFARGGSTITMQLARNLFLSPSKNPLRKLREIVIARELEAELSKGRILELYLNSIEWGEGIFGCEAAARAYFGLHCSALDPEQAALLAAVIPDPLHRSVLHPSREVERKKRWILAAMRKRGVLPEAIPLETGGLHDERP